MTPTAPDRVRVTMVKSRNGQLKHIVASVRGLGLRRPGHTVSVLDTPENRGMMRAAGHLLKIEREPQSGEPS